MQPNKLIMFHQAIFILGLIATTISAQNLSQGTAQNVGQNPLPNQTQNLYPPPQQQQQQNDAQQQQQIDAQRQQQIDARQFTLQAIMQISNGTEKFSLELYKRLAFALDGPDGRDFIISPFSVWSLLILTAEGALGNTYTQLQDVLGLPKDLTYIREGYRHLQNSLKVNTSTVELAVEQVMFSDRNRPIERDYEDKLQRIYEADIHPVNFHETAEAYYAINDYVEAKTHGKISKVVQPEDLHDLQMVLVSAIFFKGEWKFPFDRIDTKEEPFYDENGVNLGSVNMMYQKGAFGYAAHRDLKAHVLELPYGNEDRLSMYILLPQKGLSLSTVIENIANVGIARIMADIEESQAKYEDDEVEVFLPRIRMTADFTLNVVLEQMGLVDVFDAAKSNLSGIAKYSPYLSRVIHKAKIEVTEEGTVAAAVTGGTFVNKNSPSRFYANRPFAFLIVEKKARLLLFSGQVKNPTKDKF